MKNLTISDLEQLHQLVAQETGGSAGLRDRGLLESAALAPYQTFGGRDLYPTLPEKAARLCFSLVKDHPFLDGNKRIGVLAMLTLLELNRYPMDPSDDDLVSIGLGVAGGTLCAEDLRRWIVAQRLG